MTDAEKREAAHQFINRWMGRGNEDEDGRSYWLEFLSNVMGMENPTERVNFEKKVIVNGNTKRIDVYIPETHVIIEQKSLGKSLDQKIHNSGDVDLTPYEQAKRYNDNLPYDEKARWIIMRKIRQLTISIKLKSWRLLTIINWVLWKLWYRFLSEISRSDVQQRFCMKCMGSRNLRFHRVLRGFSVLRLFQIH